MIGLYISITINILIFNIFYISIHKTDDYILKLNLQV